MPQQSVFEKHASLTISFIVIILLAILYGLCSIRWISNEHTNHEKENLKTVLKQYYFGKIIDNNVGRYIKIREYKPNAHLQERPTRNYIKNIPGQLERKYYQVHVDEHGFIGPSKIHADPDISIVFLGGSTTKCLYMEETERFVYLVGRQLESRLSQKINTYNGGVSANESMHSINILINKVLAMQPNMVVLMHNINDLAMLRRQGTYWYQPSLKSHLQTSKNLFTRVEYPEVTPSATEENIQQSFRRNLQTFVAVCKINDITPVLMTQANRVDNDPLYHRLNEIIREVGNTEHITVIDLAQKIPSDLDHLYDSYHYTAKGSALAADQITDVLVQHFHRRSSS